MSVLVDWESGDDFHQAPSLRDQPPGEAASGSPCRVCRGRGYARGREDEPCYHCDGEGEEPTW